MDVSSLTPDSPDTPSWAQLRKFLDRRVELAGRLDALDVTQREATQAAQAAAANLVDLERRALTETVSGDQRRKTEQELARARARSGEPWAERQLAVRRGVADLDAEVQAFVAERFDDLRDGLDAQGREAAEAVDRAAADLLAAFAKREDVARRMGSLASAIRPVHPSDIARSRAEALARQADALVTAGGEAAPELLHDPREPRYAQPATDEAVIA